MSGEINNVNILEAVNQVVKAINDLKLSVESGNAVKIVTAGCGCTIPPDTIIDPPTAPDLGSPATDPPPNGFDTWGEYQTYKCKAANKLVDDLISTINNLTSVPGVVAGLSAGLAYMIVQAALFATGSAAIAEGLIALGLASASGVAIAISALVALVVFSAAALAYFLDVASNLGDNKEAIVCGLFNARSVEEALTVIQLAVDDAFVGIVGPVEGASDLMNKAIMAFMGTAVLNSLFEDTPGVSDYVGSVSCFVCGGDIYREGFGTVLENTSEVARINANATSGFWAVYANFLIDNNVSGNFYPNDPTTLSPTAAAPIFTVAIVDGTFTPAGGPGYWGSGSPLLSVLFYEDGDIALAPTYNDDTVPSGEHFIRSAALISSTNFAVEFTRVG